MGLGQRRARTLLDAVGQPLLLDAMEPFVAGLATDPKPGTDLRERLIGVVVFLEQQQFLFFHGGHFPGHGRHPPAPSLMESVTDVPGSIRYPCARFIPPVSWFVST